MPGPVTITELVEADEAMGLLMVVVPAGMETTGVPALV